MGSKRCPWQSCWLGINAAVLLLDFSWVLNSQPECVWSLKTSGAKVTPGRPISRVYSLHPASWSFANASTPLLVRDTLSLAMMHRGSVMKIKMSWGLKTVMSTSQDDGCIGRSREKVSGRQRVVFGTVLYASRVAYFIKHANLEHLMLSATSCVLRSLGVNLLCPF